MDIHGVDAHEHITRSNMKFLYEQVAAADRILSY
jgi:uncharacterized protein involved in oxidation of intracellular sulfur